MTRHCKIILFCRKGLTPYIIQNQPLQEKEITHKTLEVPLHLPSATHHGAPWEKLDAAPRLAT
jgi:hypothetical protein